MATEDLWNDKESPPDLVDTLSRELRQRLASEIEALPEFNAEDRPGRIGRSVSPRDAERIVGLLQDTLKEVTDRGGFIRDLPRRQANIKKLRDKIQNTKEDLNEKCEEMVGKLRAVRWMGLGGASPARRSPEQNDANPGETAGGNPPGEPGISEVEQVQTELKNLRAQCRRQCEVLLSMIHQLAVEQENCERLEHAASHREQKEGNLHRSHPRITKASPMVFRRKNSRIV